jgi:hypothetical protein
MLEIQVLGATKYWRTSAVMEEESGLKVPRSGLSKRHLSISRVVLRHKRVSSEIGTWNISPRRGISVRHSQVAVRPLIPFFVFIH